MPWGYIPTHIFNFPKQDPFDPPMLINQLLFYFFSLLILMLLVFSLTMAFTIAMRAVWLFKSDSDPIGAWKLLQEQEGVSMHQVFEDAEEQEKVERGGWVG